MTLTTWGRLAGLALILGGCQQAPLLAGGAATTVTTTAAAYQAPKITPADYQARVASGEQFQVLDARPAAPYAQEHVKGAIDLPETSLAAIAPTLPKDRSLLVYCTCDDEGLSLKIAGLLHDQYGFTRLQVILGGLAAWKTAGLPTEASSPAPAATVAP